MLKVVSNNEINFTNELLKSIAKRNDCINDETSASDKVLKSVQHWITKKLGKVRRNEEKDALHATMKACTYSCDNTETKNSIRESL